MAVVKLFSQNLEFEHPDTGETKYSVPDPLDFLLGLQRDGFVDEAGNIDPAKVDDVRIMVKDGFGFPSLTYSQFFQVVGAIAEYTETLQKKTPLTQTSQPRSGSFQRPPKPAQGSPST
jgi:hypothetical protein